MKKKILKYVALLIFFLAALMIYFSFVGIETEKFNKQIKEKIIQIDKNLDIDLKNVKLTLDLRNFKIQTKTIGTTIYYAKTPLPLEYIKTQISLLSILKKKIISSNIQVASRSVLLKDLIKFVRAKNNKPELFILQNLVKKGYVLFDLNLNLDEQGNIENDYEISGFLKDAKIFLLSKNSLEDINFNFNLKENNYLFSDIKLSTNKTNFNSRNLKIYKKDKNFIFEGSFKNNLSFLDKDLLKILNLDFKNINFKNTKFKSTNNFKLEINNNFKFKNIRFNSDIFIDQFEYKRPEFFDNYFLDLNETIILKDQKLKINYVSDKFLVEGKGDFKIREKFNEFDYSIIKYKDNLKINSILNLDSLLIKKYTYLKEFFPLIYKNIELKNSELEVNYENNDLSVSGIGQLKIEKEFEKVDFTINKQNNIFSFDTKLNLDKTNFKIDLFLYAKKNKSNSSIKISGELQNNKKLNLSKVSILEKNNKIELENLIIDKNNLIIKIDRANFDYIDVENKKNQFEIKNQGKNTYEFRGIIFNSNKLITHLLKDKDEKKNKLLQKNIKLNLIIDKVFIDEIYYVENLKGKLFIENNEVSSANINANFKNKENIFFKINSNSDGSKITNLSSSWAKPLVNRYKFIKGFEEGFLELRSVKKDGISNSLLVIDDFKVKKIPVLAKLLALASLQGIADLLTGEGIRFSDFEMKFSNKKNIMTIKELYAIGPSISILMEGYIEEDKLTSLKGTLVPASTINKTIASIPLIGDILVGKKIGEGVFGVSFKIKGPPKKLETSVNPIKTLTPRFITRTLEKIKKN